MGENFIGVFLLQSYVHFRRLLLDNVCLRKQDGKAEKLPKCINFSWAYLLVTDDENGE